MRTVDDYSVAAVQRAVRALRLSEKAATMVHALATAPNRAMSRLELARTVNSESVESCNSVLGTFARNLALELDPTLKQEWRPARGKQSDWVLFINWGPGRWTDPDPDEQDSWVFVMRETLARALAANSFAPYVPLDTGAQEVLHKTFPVEVAPTLSPSTALLDALSDMEAATDKLDELEQTEREAVALARIGQGVFRSRVVAAWGGKCAVTGATLIDALVASHIKPWREATNEERLDAANGLLLVGTLDRLFDRGYIAFDDDGSVLISRHVPADEYDRLCVNTRMRLRFVPPNTRRYLQHQRRAYLKQEAE